MVEPVGTLHLQHSVSRMHSVIDQKLLEKSSIIFYFQSRFKDLKDTLTELGSYLVDASSRFTLGKSSEFVPLEQFLEDADRAIYAAADVVDTCSLSFIENEARNFVSKYKMKLKIKSTCRGLKRLNEVAKEIGLQQRREHPLSGKDVPITRSNNYYEDLERERVSRLEESPIGIEDRIEHVIDLLRNGNHRVVGVHGMGGLGKTLLARHVFKRLEDKYDKAVMVTVSQKPSLHQIHQIQKQIREIVYQSQLGEEKKHLIVLDDVWEANDLLQQLGIPPNCQILLTTRSVNVVKDFGAVAFAMEILPPKESWELFCRFAFFKDQETPAEFKDIAEKMADRCCGLPLALKTIGRSLRGKTYEKWELTLRLVSEFHKDQGYVNKDVEGIVLNILSLSYEALPTQLKACFMSFGCFPEDRPYGEEWLVQFWMSEGYLYGQDDLHDLGMMYIRELQSLCLLELHEKYSRTFKLHALLHRVAQRVFKANKGLLLEDMVGRDSFPVDRRRFSMASQNIGVTLFGEECRCAPSLRTLILAENNALKSIPENLMAELEQLRVLDLYSTAITTVPRCIANMKLLRHLDLSHTLIEEVPEWVRHLRNLEFLGLCLCPNLKKLPDWIGELRRLQRLRFRCSFKCGCWKAFPLPKGASSLAHIRCFEGDLKLCPGDDFLKLEDLSKFKKLQGLSLFIEDVEAIKAIQEGECLTHLQHLQKLYLRNHVDKSTSMPHASSSTGQPFRNHAVIPDDVFSAFSNRMEEMILEGFKAPHGLRRFRNLVLLHLVNFQLDSLDDLRVESLPCLEFLRLEGNAHLTELPREFGKTGSFPKLHFLVIEKFPLLATLPEIEKGAMPLLKVLYIYNCVRMDQLPKGFDLLLVNLTELQVLGLGRRLMEDNSLWSRIKVDHPKLTVNVAGSGRSECRQAHFNVDSAIILQQGNGNSHQIAISSDLNIDIQNEEDLQRLMEMLQLFLPNGDGNESGNYLVCKASQIDEILQAQNPGQPPTPPWPTCQVCGSRHVHERKHS